MFQGVKFPVESNDSQACSLQFDLFHEGFQFRLSSVYLCLQLRFNGPMFQGVKFRVESADSRVCSL